MAIFGSRSNSDFSCPCQNVKGYEEMRHKMHIDGQALHLDVLGSAAAGIFLRSS